MPPPGGFSQLHLTPFEIKSCFFLYSCIANVSPGILKILSIYDLWLERYDLVLEVMSGRIFAKFGIASKAQL